MTIDETIENLKEDIEIDMYIHDIAPQIAEWLEELKELREKNTPKKPIKLNGYHQYKCPRCNDEYGCFCGSDMFGDGVESEYCQECGQKLDWSDF